MYMKEELAQNTKYQERNMDQVPAEFFAMLNHCLQLKFEEEPNYKFLKE